MAPLPEDDGRKPGDQQAWTSEQRHALTRHVDERARDAVKAYTVHRYFGRYKLLELSTRPDMPLGALTGNEMNATNASNQTRDEPTGKFYLPATTMPPNLGRVESIVEECFDFHGVVPVPYSNHK